MSLQRNDSRCQCADNNTPCNAQETAAAAANDCDDRTTTACAPPAIKLCADPGARASVTSLRQNELRCRCAYNTSLNTKEIADDCGADNRTTACAPPAVKRCTTSPAAPVTRIDPCSRANAAGCGEKPKTPCTETVRPCRPTNECEKPKSCNENDGGGVMNICEKPRACYENVSPCRLMNECQKPKTCCETVRPCRPMNECEKFRACNPNICTRLNDGCGNFDLTCYGQQFAICTDRVIKKCACVKFNGLQDTCKHPECCVRQGCLDKPFPTCPPAQKWRFTNVCCRDKKKKVCKPECK